MINFIFKLFVIGCVIYVLAMTSIGATILSSIGVGIVFIGGLITALGNFLIWHLKRIWLQIENLEELIEIKVAEKKVRSQLLDITLMVKRVILCMKIIGAPKMDRYIAIMFVISAVYLLWVTDTIHMMMGWPY